MDSQELAMPVVNVLLQNLEGAFDLDLFTRGLSLLPYDLQKEVVAYQSQMDAWRSLVGKLLWASFLGKTVLPLHSLAEFSRDNFNRPFIYGAPDGNIAHSKDWVAFACSQTGDVGIDVQAWQGIKLAAFTKSFTKKEWVYIRAADKQDQAFFRLWTRKEALVKADGRGMHLPLNTFEVLADEVQVDGKWFYLSDIDMPNGYSAAMASTVELEGLRIIRYPKMQLIGQIGIWSRMMSEKR